MPTTTTHEQRSREILWAPEVDNALAEALELPTAQRDHFIESQLGKEHLALPKIKSLLRYAEAATEMLDLPFDPTSSAAAPDMVEPGPRPELSSEGLQLGPYNLLKMLGRGGSASVFLAYIRESSPRVWVALKILDYPLPGLVERFSLEEKVLRSLDHPNVLKIYESGVSEDGRTYLAIEYVEGQTLCIHSNSRRLGFRMRLKLFLKLCSAVQHCHSRFILHRDLKPSNIAVTSEGRLVLLDFGLAKAIGGPSELQGRDTRPQERWLTPAYASPEQMTGLALSASSDIFSLGVLLHELLTGLLPRDPEGCTLSEQASSPKRWHAALANQTVEHSRHRDGRTAAEDAASDRSTTSHGLQKALKGDLDQIILRALEVDCGERYETVGDLMNDLQRYLDDIPVRSRYQGTEYRLYVLAWRYRRLLLVFGIVAMMSTIFSWSLDQANTELAAQKSRAEASADLLTRAFQAADPWQTETLRSQLLDSLTESGPELHSLYASSPEGLVEMLLPFAELLQSLGNHEKAAAEFEGVLEMLEQAPAASKTDRLKAMIGRAESLRRLNRSNEALRILHQVIALGGRGIEPSTLELALEARKSMAAILEDRNEFDKALSIRRKIQSKMMQSSQATTKQKMLAGCEVAQVLSASRQSSEAVVEIERVRSLGNWRRELTPIELVRCMETLAFSALTLGQADEALDVLNQSLEIIHFNIQDRPAPIKGRILNTMAWGYFQKGDLKHAEASLSAANQIFQRLPDHQYRLTLSRKVRGNLVLIYQLTGRAHLAVSVLEELIAEVSQADEVVDSDLAENRCLLGRILTEMGRLESAEPHLVTGAEQASSLLTQNAPTPFQVERTARCLFGLGELYLEQGISEKHRLHVDRALAALDLVPPTPALENLTVEILEHRQIARQPPEGNTP